MKLFKDGIRKLDLKETIEIYSEALQILDRLELLAKLQMEAFGERYKSYYLSGRASKAWPMFDQYYDRRLTLGILQSDSSELLNEYKELMSGS